MKHCEPPWWYTALSALLGPAAAIIGYCHWRSYDMGALESAPAFLVICKYIFYVMAAMPVFLATLFVGIVILVVIVVLFEPHRPMDFDAMDIGGPDDIGWDYFD